MSDDLNERVGVLVRREIEARVLAPYHRAVAAELGEARARELLAGVVLEQARSGRRTLRETAESRAAEGATPDLEAFAEGWEPWFRGGALEIHEHERGPDVWRFDVVRCRYAELYRALGLADLGATLSCARDAALVEGFDDSIRFERNHTLMEGAASCDFAYRRVADRRSIDAPPDPESADPEERPGDG